MIEDASSDKKGCAQRDGEAVVEILTGVGEAEPPVATHSIRAGDIVGEPHGHLYRAGRAARIDSSRRPAGKLLRPGRCAPHAGSIDQPAGLYSMENVLGFLEAATSAAARGIVEQQARRYR
mgnify:CR=1 FL=1